jgi:23S rRNA (pseudouridine1915-N3)-methyltransferase
MKIDVACVGRLKAGPVRDLCDDYARRLPWTVAWHEIAEDSRQPLKKRIKQESDEILARLDGCQRLIALDERGRDMDSEKFAGLLGNWRDGGDNRIGIAIGGADGLDDTVRNQADLVLGFGSLTWPHMMVRAMLAEQLYRAHTILTGHPYHRGG